VLQFLFMLAETAREQGMTVLVEPLGPRRTNFLTSLKETADFLSLIGADNLLISISTEEMDALGLSPRSLTDAGPLISHITIDPQSEPVLDLLDETGYSGTLAWAGGRA
jgi:hydroxypyruvate isomerase